ncbi:Dnmt3b, partial [Symbiodinium pilosum]
MLRSASQSSGRRESLADRLASRNVQKSIPNGIRSSSVPSRVTRGQGQDAQLVRPQALFPGPSGERGHSHEGWLAKRSSGKISGRWQRRYFRLQGCFLRYMQTPTSTAKKTFDLRKVRNLSVVDLHELELDFGFRVWRLRCADAATAKRWMVLLEAARLTGLRDGGGEDFSDGEVSGEESSSCTVSSSLSVTTATSFASESLETAEPSTPKFGSNVRPPPLSDILELDLLRLDGNFVTWFPFLVKSEEETRVFRDLSTAAVLDGLSSALRHLWASLSGTSEVEVPQAMLDASKAAQQAVFSQVTGQGKSSAREWVDHFFGEFLTRILQAVEDWVAMMDPSAEDLSQIAQWIVFEARPAILHFCAAGIVAGEAALSSSAIYDTLENFLLREWESRSCEESATLFAQIFEGYREAVPQLAPGLRHLGA